MTINLSAPELTELKPRIVVIGVGGAGGNAVGNMIDSGLEGVDFIVANTDAQALSASRADRRIQLGASITQGLGCGARPEVGRAAAEEAIGEILDHMSGTHMAFITAGMGGGTGTGAAPVIAQAFREAGILTVGVVTKPFQFEGSKRQRVAEEGIEELQDFVDTLIIIPNQNLFRIANEKTTFAEAFAMADNVLHSGVRGITDLMVMPGLINLDFADVRTVMGEMGKAMMGTGEAEGDKRAIDAAEAAISNPLLDEVSMKGARGVLINITGGMDLTLYELDEAANRIREEVDPDANIIVGSALDESLNGMMRVSVVATGIDVAQSGARSNMRPQLATLAGRSVAVDPAASANEAKAAGEAPAIDGQSDAAEAGGKAVPAAATPEPGVDAPRISEIMSRLRETRGAVPPANPIEPTPDPLARTAGREADSISPEPFIAPAAARPVEEVQQEMHRDTPPAPPAPTVNTAPAEPAPAEAPAAPKRKRALSLFARITGGGLGGQKKQEAPSLEPTAAVTPPVSAPGAPKADVAQAAQDIAADAEPQLAMPTDGAARTAGNAEEDMLEIPSFLRRKTK